MKLFPVIIIAFILPLLSSCGIAQWQRELLSDPIMEEQEQMPGTSDGMIPYREGSSGAEMEGGGGCGC